MWGHPREVQRLPHGNPLGLGIEKALGVVSLCWPKDHCPSCPWTRSCSFRQNALEGGPLRAPNVVWGLVWGSAWIL